MSDSLKKLASKLAGHKPAPVKAKANRTLRLDNKPYLILLRYCKRKKINLGDVTDDLFLGLIAELKANGELLPVDYGDDGDDAETEDKAS